MVAQNVPVTSPRKKKMSPRRNLVVLLSVPGILGFTPIASRTRLFPKEVSLSVRAQLDGSFDPFNLEAVEGESTIHAGSGSALSAVSLAALSLAALPDDAWAKGGEFGLAEGRIASLAHPVIMGVCFLVSIGAAYTGLQWRRVRDLQGEIGDLKAALKIPEAAIAQLEAKAATQALNPFESSNLAQLQGEAAQLTATAAEKAAARKDLVALDFRDKHWALGSVLLGLGVSFAIEGPVNTYMRAGKLFPGPHLYAGAACVTLWALAAALVPQMQKGKV